MSIVIVLGGETVTKMKWGWKTRCTVFPKLNSWLYVKDVCIGIKLKGWDHVLYTVNSKPCPFPGRRGRWLAPTWEPLGEGSPWVHAACALLWKGRAHPDWDQVGRHPGNQVFSWQALQHSGHCHLWFSVVIFSGEWPYSLLGCLVQSAQLHLV